MKLRLLFAACFVLLVSLIHVSTVNSAPSPTTSVALKRLLAHINEIAGKLRQKRDCQGYMCSHSHMSDTAGNAAMRFAINKMLFECSVNPECEQVFRKRRNSVPSSQINSGMSMTSDEINTS